MKRTILLVAILLIAMSGLAQAQTWTGTLYPGETYRQTIMNLGPDGACSSHMACYVPVVAPIPHVTLVTWNFASYYYHAADLSYGQASRQRGTVLLTTATLTWSVGQTYAATGYSDFVFNW